MPQSSVLVIILISLCLMTCKTETYEVVTSTHENGNKRRVEVRRVSDHSILEIRTFHFNQIRDSIIPIEHGLPQGEFKVWSSDGAQKASGEFQKGVLQGTLKTWYKERILESQVEMDHHKAHGILKRYYADGTLQAEEFFDHGDTVGTWKKFSPQGQLTQEWSCHARQKEGIFRQYNSSGHILFEQFCLNGVPHGVEKAYYTSGPIRHRIPYQSGLRHGQVVYYNAIGDSSVYVFDNGTGTVSTALAETTWVQGKIHGLLRWQSPDHVIVQRETWEHGFLLHTNQYRVDTASHESLRVLAGDWLLGKRHGNWRTWYSSGLLKDSMHYQNGELWGKQFHFDSTGHLYMIRRHQGRKGQVFVELLDPKPMSPP